MAVSISAQHEIDRICASLAELDLCGEDTNQAVDIDRMGRHDEFAPPAPTPPKESTLSHHEAVILSMRPTGKVELPKKREERFRFLDAFYAEYGRMPQLPEPVLRPRERGFVFVSRETIKESPTVAFLIDFLAYCHYAFIELPARGLAAYWRALNAQDEPIRMTDEEREEHERISATLARVQSLIPIAQHIVEDAPAHPTTVTPPEAPAAQHHETVSHVAAPTTGGLLGAVERINLMQLVRIAFFSWLFTTTVLVVLQSFGVTSL